MTPRGYLAWELARRPAHDEIRIPRAAFGTAQQPRPIGNRHPRAVLRDLRRGLIPARAIGAPVADRKSTRLNSSHVSISYAVFCLKKKKENSSTFRAATNLRSSQPHRVAISSD